MLALHPKATEVDYGEIELKAWPAGSHAYVLRLPLGSALQNFVFAVQNN